MVQIEVFDYQAGDIAKKALGKSIEGLQGFIEANFDETIVGSLDEVIELLRHLMHAHNHFADPTEHYDVT